MDRYCPEEKEEEESATTHQTDRYEAAKREGRSGGREVRKLAGGGRGRGKNGRHGEHGGRGGRGRGGGHRKRDGGRKSFPNTGRNHVAGRHAKMELKGQQKRYNNQGHQQHQKNHPSQGQHHHQKNQVYHNQNKATPNKQNVHDRKDNDAEPYFHPLESSSSDVSESALPSPSAPPPFHPLRETSSFPSSEVCRNQNSTSFPVLHCMIKADRYSGNTNNDEDSDDDDEEDTSDELENGHPMSPSTQFWTGGNHHHHRVPLSIPTDSRDKYDTAASDEYDNIDDMLILLQSHPPLDELDAVRSELRKCNDELIALEHDRMMLENMLKEENEYQHDDGVQTDSDRVVANESCKLSQVRPWDIDWLLESSYTKKQSSIKITHGQRRYLRRRRGRNFLLQMSDKGGKKAFMAHCADTGDDGGHESMTERDSKINYFPDGRLTNALNAGNQVSCISLLGGAGETALTSGSFFISFDDGTSFYRGALPPRLTDRMEREAQRTGAGKLPLLRYLATGPGGSYYAELVTGECWWGTCYHDEEFHNVVSEIDVHRVVFGPCFPDEDINEEEKKEKMMEEKGINKRLGTSNTMKKNSGTKMMSSWIILGRDGRSVWRNIPARLHHQLLNRGPDMAAPCEVSLGRGGSYFVKFMDGAIDYCLPAKEADVCEFVEKIGVHDNSGGKGRKRAGGTSTITNIVLHVDSCDYIIRHTGADT